ncbi:MAG TPA: MarR family transcriptional regulator [Candidatus Atribacteria bacterium]|nr:MarR family transcriptional regulator [Candidatus Atribacteria bacterium]
MLNKESSKVNFLNLEGIDPISLQAFQSLSKFMRFHSQLLFKLTSEKGIYPGQAVCLWFINQNSGISQRDLAEKMHVAPPTVTLMLQKLEKAGLVIRKEDERDQRLSHTYLTNAGVDTLNVLNSILAEIINTSLENLSHDEQRNLMRLLDIINSNIERKL